MSGNWPAKTVRELTEARVLVVEDGNHGEYRPRAKEFTSAGGWAYIRAADMANGEVNFRFAEKINDIARERITKGIGAPGDIIFSHKGTVGKLAVVPDDAPAFVCSPQTTFWRTIDEYRLDRRFLYAFMRSRLFRIQWNSRKGETDMADYVSLTAQRTFAIPVPQIEQQRAIGDALEPLEERIRVSRTYGRALHRIAERLFRSWFVDLDALTAGIESETGAGLSGRLAKLYPKGLVEVGGVQIPAGWQIDHLDSIAKYRNGIAMQKFPPTDNRYLPVLKIAQLRDGHLAKASQVRTDLPEDVVANDGDVVFSWSGTLMVKIWCGGRAAVNQHLFKVTSKAYPKWFYYFWTRKHLTEFQDIAADKKTTMGHIKRQHLTEATVLVPNPPFLKAADAVLAPMLDRYILCELQARRLETLRDNILRSLMSGQVSVEAGALHGVPT
jgi:type I restriction enzyme S subunit